MNNQQINIDNYQLEDRYKRSDGRVFLTGTQALVRLPIIQRQLDKINGLNTAGFISGYRGSPLGGYDMELWGAKSILDQHDISFHPGINEELAATAVMGTQQVEVEPNRSVDGVFSIWYGKGPGVDRAGDALKHGNAYGSSKHGGVLMLFGDDHGCVSSSMSHQSDVAAMSWYSPVIHPASVAEYIQFGLWGWALSRYSGMWVAFKAISEVVESGASVEIAPMPTFQQPSNLELQNAPLNSNLHFRWPDLPGMQIENRMIAKKNAVIAFAQANPIDRRIYNTKNARMGIITTGKAHHDLMEALSYLGVDEKKAHEIGLDIYKVGMVWPIEPKGVMAFLKDKEEVLVIEEKRGLIESQLKELLYDYPGFKPKRMVGKYDEQFQPLITWTEELSPSYLAPIVARRLEQIFDGLYFNQALAYMTGSQVEVSAPQGVKRLPYFCSGCPHNTSTKVPEGSEALAGIGCHFMASWMDRKTSSLIQMGGEGIGWVGKSRYLGNGHIFQNLGEGTYFHSGHLAIRQAIASGVNITYKILFNEATAMTGGQPVDGQVSVLSIAKQVASEGAKKIMVVSDEPEKYTNKDEYPNDVTFHHRSELDTLQRQLRVIPGTTILIYDQTCAAEKRRLRKKKLYPDPAKRVVINERVCEGCGDCSAQSNCLSIYPVKTEFGVKRKIDQSSCNKDYSCVNGFCPSFITIEGGQLRKPKVKSLSNEINKTIQTIPNPVFPTLEKPFNLLVGGVGGTGVVTVGALISMAAHLEGKGGSVLDFMGFAQKGGTVLSYVRVADKPDNLHQVRIDYGMADALIACDILVGTDQRSINVLRKDKSKVIVNLSEVPSGDFVLDRDANMHTQQRVSLLKSAVGEENVSALSASDLAEKLLGNTVYSNVFLLGYAWQKGVIPISLEALMRAIEINGVSIEQNQQGFQLGRIAAHDVSLVLAMIDAPQNQKIDLLSTYSEVLDHRYQELIQYQNTAYAEKYRMQIETFNKKIKHHTQADYFSLLAAKYLYKLMAYKDEYEVARLHSGDVFKKFIQNSFEGDYKVKYHMAPPLIARKKDAQGRPRKMQFDGWMGIALKIMAKAKCLRGSMLDVFSYTDERKSEIKWIGRYQEIMEWVSNNLNNENAETAEALLSLPEQIRGYGPVKEEAMQKAKQFSDQHIH